MGKAQERPSPDVDLTLKRSQALTTIRCCSSSKRIAEGA